MTEELIERADAAVAETEKLLEEEQVMDREIERLETEARELEAPCRVPTWDELQEAGAAEDLERRERRRGVLPRLLLAAKLKRLEIRRERYEQEAAPLRKLREEAHERLEAAEAKRREAVEEEEAARYEWGDAHGRIEGHEKRMKAINREISELKGGEG